MKFAVQSKIVRVGKCVCLRNCTCYMYRTLKDKMKLNIPVLPKFLATFQTRNLLTVAISYLRIISFTTSKSGVLPWKELHLLEKKCVHVSGQTCPCEECMM